MYASNRSIFIGSKLLLFSYQFPALSIADVRLVSSKISDNT